MSNLLTGASRRLVEQTEAELGVQVHVKLSPGLAVGYRALVQDMKRTGELVILLVPDRKDHQYLIAQGCLHALESRNESFSLRDRSKGREAFEAILQERGLEDPEAAANHIIHSIGTQLRGAPLLARSAQAIYNDYSELRDDQRKYFKLDCAEGALSLTHAPEQFKGVAMTAHLAMNGAIALVADYLFDDTAYYKPYEGTPTDSLSTDLVNDLFGVDRLGSEKAIVEAWIQKLSLDGFYKVVGEPA